MAESKRRSKFTNERHFSLDQDQFVVTENPSDDEQFCDNDDLSGIEPLDGDDGTNINQNAHPFCSPREEGEASSDSETDLRDVIKAKQRSKIVSNPSDSETFGSDQNLPSTSRGPMVERAQADNANFENFMVWMDKYKQFQEWEAQQKEKVGPRGTVSNQVHKAIQSPSESTVYTRMCKSLTSESGSQLAGSMDNSVTMENGQMIVEQGDCCSTASTIDDYANVDINQIDELILDARRAAERENKRQASFRRDEEIEPPRKKGKPVPRREELEAEEETRRLQAEKESKERRDKILLDAELHRAELLKPGMNESLNHLIFDAQHRSLGSHIDKAMVQRIVRGDYVELHELLPRKRVGRSRFTKPTMRLVNDNGSQKWVEDQDDQIINSYRKWEEAFEIYASIYAKGNPGRADELYDYKYTIRDAANTYIWDNVYDYDIEFRLHMEKCKNKRRWSAKLDYEWSRCLKNHISFRHDNGGQGMNGQGNTGNKAREICNRYNKGRCTWGSQCRYLHICKLCKKRGHGALLCRSDKAEKTSPMGRNDRNNDKPKKSDSKQSL